MSAGSPVRAPARRPDRPREHAGEQAVQKKAGEGGPDWGTPMFTPEIPLGFVPFFREQQLVAISGPAPHAAGSGAAGEPEHDLWCSVLMGEAGFVDPVDARTVVIHAVPAPGDPLSEAYQEPNEFAMVVMSPQTLRRVKVSGVAWRRGDTLVVTTEQVLGNCPKYLQQRVPAGPADGAGDGAGAEAVVSDVLSPAQQEEIASADTFFIGSLSPEHGADANHRGGMPGFVTVEGPGALSWPDYFGNSFYMTLGNLELNPRCGLAFPVWETGGLLLLTGSARIDWDPDRAAASPGALRIVRFAVERAVQIERANPLRWELMGYSRFNPPPTWSGLRPDAG